MLDSRSKPGLTDRKLWALVILFPGLELAGGGGGGDALAGQLSPILTTLGDFGGGEGLFPLPVLGPFGVVVDGGGGGGGVGLIGLLSGTGGLGAKLGFPKLRAGGL